MNNKIIRCLVVLAIASFAAVQSGCHLASSGDCLQGNRFYQQGNYNQALASFQKAINRSPQNADAYYNIGAVYQQVAKQTKNSQWLPYAENYFRQVIQLNDQHPEAHRSLAVLLMETNRKNYAFDLIRTWQARHPESPEPLVELARLYHEHNDQQNAVQYLADAISIDGSNPRALKAMGVIREQQGQYQLALDNYIRSYQADNLQSDLPPTIANLQSRLQLASLPQFPQTNPYNYRQGSLTQPGTAGQFVPH